MEEQNKLWRDERILYYRLFNCLHIIVVTHCKMKQGMKQRIRVPQITYKPQRMSISTSEEGTTRGKYWDQTYGRLRSTFANRP